MTGVQSVLVVDDSQGICQTMSMILKRKGFDVDCAYDGPTAIDMVTRRPYDSVLMDIRLPGMDGVEASARIMEIRPGTHIAVMTAYALTDLVKRAIALGVERVFYKPLDMDELIAYIAAGDGPGPAGRPRG